MGEHAAAEPPEAEDDQLGARNLAVRALEFGDCRAGQRDQRAFGDAGIAIADRQRIAAPGRPVARQARSGAR